MVEVRKGQLRHTPYQEINMPLWMNRDRDKIAAMGEPPKTHESGLVVHSHDPSEPPKKLVDLFTNIQAVVEDYEREAALSPQHLKRVK